MIEPLFFTVLEISIMCGGVYLILCLLTPLLMKRYRAKTRYLIWIVLAVRLALPLQITLPLPVDIPLPARAVSVLSYYNDATAPTIQPVMPEEGNVAMSGPYPNAAVQAKGLPVAKICSLLWLAGIVVYAGFHAGVYILFFKRTLKQRQPIDNAHLTATIQEVCRKLGMDAAPEIAFGPDIQSPMIAGLFRPVILLPHDQYTEEALAYILSHELTHYKRGDIGVKLLLTAVKGLHWFNPIIHLFCRRAGQDIELSCDEAVAAGLTEKERAAYAETLLIAAEPRGAVGGVGIVLTSQFSDGRSVMKRRLKSIFDLKVKRRGTAVVCAVLVTTVVTGSFMNEIKADAKSAAISIPAGTALPEGMSLQDMTKGLVEMLLRLGEKGTPQQEQTQGQGGAQTAVGAEVPVSLVFSGVYYDDTIYHWPFQEHLLINNSGKDVSAVEIVCLAFDKDGNPLELHWDARNMDASGGYGNVGFGDGVDYGYVTGIYPVSPASYRFSHNYEFFNENGPILPPGAADVAGGWALFDGWWDQPGGVHKAAYIISCVETVTFTDGTQWDNSPAAMEFLAAYEGKPTDLEILNNFFD